MRLRLTQRADEDLTDIFNFIRATSDVRDGVRIADAIIVECEKLAALSGTMGRPRPELAPGVRSFPFRGYVIFFRYEDDELVVLNVLSSRRDIESSLEQDD